MVLSGCTQGTSSLLALPRSVENNTLLAQQSPGLFTGSISYTVPRSGDTAASAVSIDLDADGNDEIVSFLIKGSRESSHPRVEVYSNMNGKIDLISGINGAGNGIHAAFFPVFNREGKTGLVVGWALEGSDLHGLIVCTLDEGELTALYSGTYRELFVTDIDGDGLDEILYISGIPGADSYQIIMLKYTSDGGITASSVSLSNGLTEFVSTQVAKIGFNSNAVIVEGYIIGYGYVSDIISWSNGELVNLYRSEITGVSDTTARSIPIFCMDVNNDGITELPSPRTAPGYNDEDQNALKFIDWHRCNNSGESEILMTTYHMIAERWYMRLPAGLEKSVMPVRSVDTEFVKATLFYYYSGEGERGLPLWEIYTFSGDDAESNMARCALQKLGTVDGKVFGLRVYNLLYGSIYTKSSLASLFFKISSENFLPYTQFYNYTF